VEPHDRPDPAYDDTDGYWKPEREAALHALLEGNNQIQTASIVGVNVRTIRRYQREPEFAKRLREGRGQIRETQRNRAVALHGAALDVLEDLLEADADQVKLNAAKTILRLSEAVDADDLSARLAEVEDHLFHTNLQDGPPTLLSDHAN